MGERQFWQNHTKNFYSVRNPEYLKEIKKSAEVNQAVRKLFGEKMALYENHVAIIGNPLDKANEKASNEADKAKDGTKPNAPVMGADTKTEAEKAKQRAVDAMMRLFTEVVKDYRTNLERNINTSSLTAYIHKNELKFAKESLYIIYDDDHPSEFYIDVGKNPVAGRRFRFDGFSSLCI